MQWPRRPGMRRKSVAAVPVFWSGLGGGEGRGGCQSTAIQMEQICQIDCFAFKHVSGGSVLPRVLGRARRAVHALFFRMCRRQGQIRNILKQSRLQNARMSRRVRLAHSVMGRWRALLRTQRAQHGGDMLCQAAGRGDAEAVCATWVHACLWESR
eukprot:jgi/Ulvmu1/9704/UM055_0042.1